MENLDRQLHLTLRLQLSVKIFSNGVINLPLAEPIVNIVKNGTAFAFVKNFLDLFFVCDCF